MGPWKQLGPGLGLASEGTSFSASASLSLLCLVPQWSVLGARTRSPTALSVALFLLLVRDSHPAQGGRLPQPHSTGHGGPRPSVHRLC